MRVGSPDGAPRGCPALSANPLHVAVHWARPLPLRSWCPAEPADVSRDTTPLCNLRDTTRVLSWGLDGPAATGALGTRVWRGGRGRGWQGTWWKQKAVARWGAARAGGPGRMVTWGPGYSASWQLQGPSVPLLENRKLAVLPFLTWSRHVQLSVAPIPRAARPAGLRGCCQPPPQGWPFWGSDGDPPPVTLLDPSWCWWSPRLCCQASTCDSCVGPCAHSQGQQVASETRAFVLPLPVVWRLEGSCGRPHWARPSSWGRCPQCPAAGAAYMGHGIGQQW